MVVMLLLLFACAVALRWLVLLLFVRSFVRCGERLSFDCRERLLLLLLLFR
jgi:hypothetical protein